MKLRIFIKTVSILTLHISALAFILIAYIPIAKWYFFHRPILGVDFFNTATYARFLSDNFHILPYGFKYFWFGGSPIAEEVVLTWFIPFAFFAKVFPLIESIKIASLFFFVLLALFVYLASCRLSKNQFVSALITVLVIYSANMYGALVWGGSLPYFANQLFFPFTLWLLASYLQTGNRRWYWLSVLVVGLSFLGHLSNGTAFVFVGSVILIMFGTRATPVSFLYRIREAVILFIISFFFASRVTNYFGGLLVSVLKGGLGGSAAKVSIEGGGIASTVDQSLIAFERSHFLILFSDTNRFLFLLFAVAMLLFVIGFFFDRKKSNVFGVIVWLILAGYSVMHVFLNSYGVSFLAQAWYRAFWHFPITLGLATAALIGYFSRGFAISVAITSVSIVALAGLLYTRASDQTIQFAETRSSPSSAHPEAINLVRNQQELEALKPKLVPSWFNPNDRMYRLFTSDAQVNVWWNTLFSMPLVRWYIDPPVGAGALGHHFLLDQAIAGDGLVQNFKYPLDTAKNMAFYYLDWYAVKYFEGGHLSKSPNKAPSSYLTDAIVEEKEVEARGALMLYQTKSGKPEIWEDVPQYLKYYQFKGELVTPILSVSNAPSVLCFCEWPAYESFTKIFAMNNINSQVLVTVFSPENIDEISASDLSRFDAIFLIDYNYKNKHRAFSNLLTYAEKGGKVFIDTGSEVTESTSSNLPEIFPFRLGERAGLGKSWNLEASSDSVFEDIDFEAFSPPIYNEYEWKFSYPVSDIDTSSEILLRNHKKPVLIRKRIGIGEIVWSGMNLAYHVHANTNVSESRFFINLVQAFVSLTRHEVGSGKPQFISDRHVTFTTDQSAKGILFKEHNFAGWKFHINEKEVKGYKAGPTFPGFIYIPLEKEIKGAIVADFTFWGQFDYHFIPRIVTVAIGILLLDLILLNGFIFAARLSKLVNRFKIRIARWWKREEE